MEGHTFGCELSIATTGGATYTEICRAAGSKDDPLPESEVRQKFMTLAGMALPPDAAVRIEQAVMGPWTGDTLRRAIKHTQTTFEVLTASR